MLTAPPPLRDYQATLVDQASAIGAAALDTARLTGAPEPVDVLIQAATGSGKTRTGLEIVLRHLARSPRHRVIWFAHRDELVEQPLGKLRAWGAPVAALRPGEQQDASARVLVASIQTTLRRGVDELGPRTLVVYDECRRYSVGAAEWHAVALAAGAGVHRLGLDATPTGDLRPLFRHMLHGPSVAALTAAGFLVPAVHIGPVVESERMTIDPIDDYLLHLRGQRAILFAANVAEAQRFTLAAQARGVRAACVEGKTKTAARRGALAAYLRGEVDLLVNVNCFIDGVDLPATEGIIIARRVSDEDTWVQIGGRGMRPSPGKTRALILDPYGLTHRLGWMADERIWHNDGTEPTRPGALPAVVICTNCLGIAPPAAICPGCGWATPPAPPKPITPAEQKVLEQDKRPRRGPMWERFCAIVEEARAKGWNPRAVPIAFQREFGRFPAWRIDHVPLAAGGGAGGAERRSA